MCPTGLWYNYRMAQTTKWLPAILDYTKNAMSNISEQGNLAVHVDICETEHSEVYCMLVVLNAAKYVIKTDVTARLNFEESHQQ